MQERKLKVVQLVRPKNSQLGTRINKQLKELFLKTLEEDGETFTEWLEERILKYLKEKGKIENV